MKNKNMNLGGNLEGLTDWSIFIIASIMLFTKTSEVFASFAPERCLGFTGAKDIYGAVCALLVEGVLVLAKLSLNQNINGPTFIWTVLLLGMTWLFSASMQLMDGFTQAAKAGMLTDQQKQFQSMGSWIIPLVPSIIMGAVLVKSIVAKLPDKSTSIQVVNAPIITRRESRQIADLFSQVMDRLLPAKSGETIVNSLDTEKVEIDRSVKLLKGSRKKLVRVETRREELTEADKEKIARMTKQEIMATYLVTDRTARNWMNDVQAGKL